MHEVYVLGNRIVRTGVHLFTGLGDLDRRCFAGASLLTHSSLFCCFFSWNLLMFSDRPLRLSTHHPNPHHARNKHHYKQQHNKLHLHTDAQFIESIGCHCIDFG